MTNGTGALRTPPDLLAKAWPIALALAAPTAAPLKFHSPKCQPVTIDQNGYGACEPFSGAYIHADQELADEGKQLLPNVLDPLHVYALVKGLAWPSPNVAIETWDPSPGMYSAQLWDYTKRVGWATKDGGPPRKDGSYYSLGKPSASAAFLDALQQTILQIGPFQFTAEWPSNWFGTDAHGFMATPGAASPLGHAFETLGALRVSLQTNERNHRSRTAMERIGAAVAAKNWSMIAPDFSVTLSAGIASHRKGENIEQLLHRADLALYQAKNSGRNTVIASP